MIARTLVTALFVCLGALLLFADGLVCRLSRESLGNAPTQPQVLLTSGAQPESRGLAPIHSSLGVAGLDFAEGERIWPFAGEDAPAPQVAHGGVAARPHAETGFLGFIARGMQHFALGWDHVLFVLCLVWLAASARSASTALTAFTAGLALSLTLVTLGVLHVPTRVAELLVALSLVWMGGSVLLEKRGDVRLVWPAAGFGLIHGVGFAQALPESGLVPQDAPAALLGVNAGVALGLLLVALAAGLLVRGLAALVDRHRVDWVGAYAVGCLAGALGVYWALSQAGLG